MGMNMREQFEGDSEWLKAADLQGREVQVTIAEVTTAKFQDQSQKPAIRFQNKEKGMVLNKTNGMKIVDAYGEDSDDWLGQKIIVYPDKTEFQGKQVDCLRVRIPRETVDESEVPF